MKLELKHLAPYLPYELKGKTLHTNHECVLSGLGKRLGKTFDYEIKSGSGFITLTAGLSNFKPILRPLSDLTDGKVKELFGDKFSSFKCMLYDGTLNLDTSDLSSVNLIYYLPQINKLFEYQFDVFGLIEKGLAIDINTNSYEHL